MFNGTVSNSAVKRFAYFVKSPLTYLYVRLSGLFPRLHVPACRLTKTGYIVYPLFYYMPVSFSIFFLISET